MIDDFSTSRRHFMAAGLAGFAGVADFTSWAPGAVSPPAEPLDIGAEPQFVFDLHVIDNVWAIKYKSQSMRRVAHAPVKYEGNPLIPPQAGSACVRRDPAGGKFRIWYQSHKSLGPNKGDGHAYMLRYAESDDGLKWDLPKLGLVEFEGSKDNNILLGGQGKKDRYSGPFLVDAPEKDRRGYRYLLTTHSQEGLILMGSHDGLQWDQASRTLLKHMHSDTQNGIVYDPLQKRYLMYCRAKHIYRTFAGEIIDTGESRRIALLTNPTLWDEWTGDPQNILVPDDADYADEKFNAFYGMPVRYYGGVFWGALWRFRFNDDIHTQLTFSRDGVRFDRLPERPKFLPLGEEGTWDDGMTFGSMDWVDVGDEWWFYYSAYDGPHGISERDGQIGLAKLRKEGFISMRGPAGGGVLVTRPIRWPGGDLVVNANSTGGELRVRVAEAGRKPREGFNYDDCTPFSGDAVRHAVRWGDRSLDALKGEVIRLEFLLNNAELYTFLAVETRK